MDVTRVVMQMKDQGIHPCAMRARIDATYARWIDKATPAPYPPAYSGLVAGRMPGGR